MTARVLVDTGALVALIDKGQVHNSKCRTIVTTLPLPLVTTWSVYTEAMYLLYGLGGWVMQHDLWGYVVSGVLRLHTPAETEPYRMMNLMGKYHDRPMDLADATLVTAAETLGTNRIFTLDSDFYVYRLHETAAFDVIDLSGGAP